MSWTVLVKSPVISQWADFSVTAPSWLVPWPAFYDGTETVSVTWSSIFPSWWQWSIYWWVTFRLDSAWESPREFTIDTSQSEELSIITFKHLNKIRCITNFNWRYWWLEIDFFYYNMTTWEFKSFDNTLSPIWDSCISAYLNWNNLYINLSSWNYYVYDLSTISWPIPNINFWSLVPWVRSTWTLLWSSFSESWLTYQWAINSAYFPIATFWQIVSKYIKVS